MTEKFFEGLVGKKVKFAKYDIDVNGREMITIYFQDDNYSNRACVTVWHGAKSGKFLYDVDIEAERPWMRKNGTVDLDEWADWHGEP